jgi:hypothetical protein
VTKALDVITASLQKLGIYSPVETISTADQGTGSVVLGDMIDEWFSEYIYPQQRISTTFPVAVDQSVYTIGPENADITAARPSRMLASPDAASFIPTGGTISFVNVVSAVEWHAFHASAAGVSDQQGTPDTMYYDPQYPTGVIMLAPTPVAVGELTCQPLSTFIGFADLNTTDYNLDFGTVEALKNNLAVALKPYFSQSALNPATVLAAAASKAALKRRTILSRAMLRRDPRPAPLAAPEPPSA